MILDGLRIEKSISNSRNLCLIYELNIYFISHRDLSEVNAEIPQGA